MLNWRKFLKTTGAVGAAGALATPDFFFRSAQAANTIQVGVLFSLTGGLSIIEKSLARRDHDGDLRDQRKRWRQGNEDRGDRRRRRVRSENLQRKGVQARHSGSACRRCSDPIPRRAARRCCRCSRSATISTSTRPTTKASSAPRTSSIPAPFPTSSCRTSFPGSSRPRQEEVLHRRIELHLSARDGEGLEDPDREEWRRVDRRRISRARPLRMGLDGQQDQGLGLRRGPLERGRRLRSLRSTASTRTRA